MSTVAEIKMAIESLSPKERAELERLLREPREETPQSDFLARAKKTWGEQPPGKPLSAVVAERKEVVETVCGKYGEQMRPSEAFMHDKVEEKRLEERRWQS